MGNANFSISCHRKTFEIFSTKPKSFPQAPEHCTSLLDIQMQCIVVADILYFTCASAVVNCVNNLYM